MIECPHCRFLLDDEDPDNSRTIFEGDYLTQPEYETVCPHCDECADSGREVIACEWCSEAEATQFIGEGPEVCSCCLEECLLEGVEYPVLGRLDSGMLMFIEGRVGDYLITQDKTKIKLDQFESLEEIA